MQTNVKPRLSIVFLSYNRLSETSLTVRRLQQLFNGRDDIEVIAVDNASTDGTLAFLQSNNDWLNIIQMKENKGIAGLNEGFKAAAGDYIMVLDDDSHPYDQNTIDTVISCLDQNPEIGTVAFRIENENGRRFQTWHLPVEDQAGPSPAFVGCGFAIRRTIFKQIGWYPERFFLYQNEIEVAIRVMTLGYKIHYEPGCRVVHRESLVGRTGWRQVYFPTRNTIWIIRRYFSSPMVIYLIATRLCIGLFRAIQTKEFVWYFRAVRDALTETVEQQTPSREVHLQISTLWKQNSLFHQIFYNIMNYKLS